MEINEVNNSILWVGPGTQAEMFNGPWPKALELLMSGPDPLRISKLKLLDTDIKPAPFFNLTFAQKHGIVQITEQGDFFKETNYWDIIILDFIEAWRIGSRAWAPPARAPYEIILSNWERQLRKLQPYQIWVRHDALPLSTIMPMLSPVYSLVVNAQSITRRTVDGYKSEKNISISHADYWSKQAAEQFEFLHVWQLK